MAAMDSPRLYVKDGVDLSGLTPAGCRILAVVAAAPLVLGFDLTISCGREAHGPEDPHTIGSALDVRTNVLTPEQILALRNYCQGQLGPDFFTVLLEVPVAERAALDPRLAGMVYIPSDPDAQHLHLQRRIGTNFGGPSAANPVRV